LSDSIWAFGSKASFLDVGLLLLAFVIKFSHLSIQKAKKAPFSVLSVLSSFPQKLTFPVFQKPTQQLGCLC
jgi:hypothetical protein